MNLRSFAAKYESAIFTKILKYNVIFFEDTGPDEFILL